MGAEVIGGDGRIKDRTGIAPQGAVFRAQLAVSQPAASGFRTVLLAAKDFDPFGWYDATTGRFQPKVAGYYDISWNVAFNVNPGQIVASVWKNGAEYMRLHDRFESGTTQGYQIGGSGLVYFNGTTDYIEYRVFSGNSVSVIGDSPPFGRTAGYAALVGVSAGVVPEPWHIVGATGEPAFQNGWTNLASGFSVARFFKDPHGVVHLDGLLSAPGAVGNDSIPFTLPAGYRPAYRLILAGQSSVGYSNSRVDVATDGTVRTQGVWTAGGQWVSLAGMTFRAEQ